MLAEVSRIILQDDAGYKKRVEQAARAQPQDPRPVVSKFVEAVRSQDPAQIGKLKLSDPDALAELGAGIGVVAGLRGFTPKSNGTRVPRHVAEAVLWARQAIAAEGSAAAVEQVMLLRQASFSSAASWLGAATYLRMSSWWKPSSQRKPRGKKERLGTAE
jgi:hypothetical protein